MLADRLALPALVVLQITLLPARGGADSPHLPGGGREPELHAAGPPTVTRSELGFGEKLRVGDTELAGPRASARVDFFMEPGAKPAPGSVLRLVFEHSADLDESSLLSVRLNHGVLRSLRLDAGRGTRGELEIAIPEGMLQASNHLVFLVEQAAARDKRAWTRILARSSLSLAYERVAVEWTLSGLPAPLLHRRTYEERRLSVLLPSDPSTSTVEGMALAIANLCSGVAPQPVSLAFVRQLAEATAPVLMAGTPREQPGLRDLALPQTLRLISADRGFALAADGKRVGDSTGVLALVTTAGRPPVLVLTGNTPEGVARAAGALRLSGTKGERVRLVRSPPMGGTRGPREWKGFAPPRKRFTLGEIGDEDAELAVTAGTPAHVRLRVTPDARFLPYGHALRLAFRALPAMAEDAEAVMEVYWNDTLVRQEALRSFARTPYFTLPFRLPAHLLRLDNVLTVAWNGRSGSPGPFVALQPESEFHLPREFTARVPDLALLRSSFYPLSLHADLSDTVVVPAEGAGEDGLAALGELAAWLGRLLPGDRIAFKVVRPADLPARRSAANLILLETPKSAAIRALPLPDTRGLHRGEALRRLPFLAARVSPWNAEKHVLRLRAPSPTLLRAAARSLSRPALMEQLAGDTAFLAAEGAIGFNYEPRRTVAEVSYLTRLDAWLRDNWLALPAILMLVSGLLFMGLRLTFEQRRAARAAPRPQQAA